MADGDNLLLGRKNTSSRETHITRSGATPFVDSLVVENHSGRCVVGNSGSGADGVVGTSATGNGVQGVSQEGGTGVAGRCSTGNGIGVRGEGSRSSAAGTGVQGEGGAAGVVGIAHPIGGDE